MTRSKKVLIVDDDESVCSAMYGMIHDILGYACSYIADPIQALVYLTELPKSELPDVLLLDYSMPRMNGAEFRRRQLSNENLAQIRTIVYSGSDTSELLRAFKGMSVEILQKPVGSEQIASLLTQ